jgi:GAF domain-containing protein
MTAQLEPMPETREALREFMSLQGPDVENLLTELGRHATRIVPELVGLSLGLAEDGLTFTLLAASPAVAALDAMQYLDGGPCVEVTEGRMDSAEVDLTDPLDEQQWQLFAQVSAASGVASSLSLPIYHHGVLVGGVNLYASTPDAFAGRQAQLAQALGTPAAEAVSNADLSFSTRLAAAAAPSQLKDSIDIETATGMIAGVSGVALDEAERLLYEASARAAGPPALVARILVIVHSGWLSP